MTGWEYACGVWGKVDVAYSGLSPCKAINCETYSDLNPAVSSI